MATSYFLHAADLHLGAQLESLGDHLSVEEAQVIRDEVSKVFDDLVSLAIDKDVEFVVLAGDIYDQAESDPSAKQRVYRGYKRLNDAGIRVFVVHGNHDPVGKNINTVSDAPDNVHVFKHGEVTQSTVVLKNGVEVTVAGISYEKQAETENLALKFNSVTGSTIVGVLHTNVGNIETGGHSNYAPCSQEDLKNSPVNYWALGHIHQRRVVETPKGYWAYPGNLQGRSTKATECGAKGVLIVGIDEYGKILEPVFNEVDRVRFQKIPVDVNECLTDIQALEEIKTKVRECVQENEGIPQLFSIEIVGRTDAYDQLAEQEEKLLENIRNHVFDVIENGHILKVENVTQRNFDPQELRQRSTVLAAALRALDNSDVDANVRAAAERLLIDKLAVNV